jgi:predicted DNA-binding protein YlxM (UPF0122 family)
MSTNKRELTTTQHRVIAELLYGSSITEISKTVGISRQTIYKYLKKPAFQAVLAQELNAFSTALYGQVLGYVSKTVYELHLGTSIKAFKHVIEMQELCGLVKELRDESRAINDSV